MHELGEQLGGLGAGVDDSAAGVDDRPLGFGDHLHRARDVGALRLGLRPIAAVLDLGRRDVAALGLQHVLGQVDHDRARTAVGRDISRLVHDPRQVLDRFDQVVVLRAGPRDARGVGLLESVVADQVSRHLTGQAEHRNRVHQGVGQAGDRVGRARTRGHQDRAQLAAGSGIALGRVDRALLVANQDVAQGILLEQCIIDRQDRAAGIAEDDVDALIE